MTSVKHTLKLIAVMAVLGTVAIWHAGRGQAQPRSGSDRAVLKTVKFRPIGPPNGGRVDSVAGVPGNPNIYYLGAAAGGVFKSVDGGLTWKPVSEHLPVATANALAVSASDPNIVWLGTGETNLRGNISWGNGVYKSTDGGATWTPMGLDDCRSIGRIVIDPHNPDIVLVAGLGHQFGPNKERGVFRTTDGGKRWEKVLYKDEKTGAIDIALDPNNPRILFATLWQVYRAPWGLFSGGPGSGLYKSTDGGVTWTELNEHGLPTGIKGKMGVAVAPSNSNRVYAIIESDDGGGLWRSDDGGENWRRVNKTRAMTQRPFYYMTLVVSPDDENHVYVPQVPFLHSADGGRTFERIPHGGDNHALWIDPRDSKRMILGNDGGVAITTNGGKSWIDPELPIGQFYHVFTDNRTPYYVCGEQQDGPTICGPSISLTNSLTSGGIARSDWYDAAGGESGWAVPDPVDPHIVWASGYQGDLTRYDLRTQQGRHVNVWPEDSMGWGAEKLKYRFQWTMPVMISPHDHNTVYVGGNVLFKTTDGGNSWTAVSPDLTRNDKSKQQRSGGLTGDNTSVEYFDTIFSMAESPKQAGVIWVGTDDGLVQVTKDGGKAWTNLTRNVPALPEWGAVDNIEASPHDPGTAYVPFDFHKLDNNDPYVYKTSDYGATWKSIRGNLPAGSNVHVIREDPVRKGLLYVGTETGLWISFDDGGRWEVLQNNLPTSPIHDLTIQRTANDLVVATHGRGFWILDDLSPLQQLTAQVTDAEAYLFKSRPAVRYWGARRAFRPTWGQNPDAGAAIRYYLKSVPKDDVTITIGDAQGRVVRTISSARPPAAGGEVEARLEPEEPDELAELFGPPRPVLASKHAGINTTMWDFRYEGATRSQGAIVWQSGGLRGPVAVPGTYQVKVTAGGQTGRVLTGTIEVQADPRSSVSQADLEAQLKLGLQLREKLSNVATTLTTLRSVRKQVVELAALVRNQPNAGPIAAAAKDLEGKLDAVEDLFTEREATEPEDVLQIPIRLYNKLSSLSGWEEAAEGAPTKSMLEVDDKLNGDLQAAMGRYNELLTRDVAAFNRVVQQQNIPPIVVPAARVTSEGARP